MYTKHAEEFAGKNVVEFNDASSWQGPDAAYRVGVEWEGEHTVQELLAILLEQPGADQLTHLVIGFWDSDFEGVDAGPIVQFLVEQADRLSNLTALFLGDITGEEQEVSWITQSNVTPLLVALPKLQWFQVRGGSELSFERTSHAALTTLIIESGGLPRSVLREIALCDFPALEHLELHLGEDNYGWDGTVDDLRPFLSGERYPNLRYLGLRDSTIVDEIAAVVVNAPITKRIETLDLSLGNMSESGARSLMMLPRDGRLKRLDVTHHYIPADVVAQLKQSLPFEVIADDPQDLEDDWRPIMHAE